MNTNTKEQLQQTFGTLYKAFHIIIEHDSNLNKLIKENEELSVSKKDTINLFTLLTLKEFLKDSETEDLKAIYNGVDKLIIKHYKDNNDLVQIVKTYIHQFFETWIRIFMETLRKATDKDEDKEKESTKHIDSDKISKIFNDIANSYAGLMSKEEEFKSILTKYDKSLHEKIVRAIVFCFLSHLFQNILKKTVTYDWSEILGDKVLHCFKVAYASLNKIRDELSQDIDNIDELKDQIDELYQTYGNSYHKKVFRKLTEE